MSLSSLAFDETFYLQQNPDVLAAILAGAFTSAEQHYNLFGKAELRAPNSYFDPKAYLANNTDVLAAGVDPFEHFLAFGAKEGRLPIYASTFTSDANAQNVFDVEDNFNNNGTPDDLAVTGETFNETSYLNANADVASAVSSGAFASGYHHWVLFGQFENRQGAETSTGAALASSQNTGGVTVALTTNNDTPSTTEAGDTITAGAGTLDSGDVIDGKGGNDVLTVTGNTQEAATISNVETIITSQTDNVDLDKASGYTRLVVNDVAGGFTNIEVASPTLAVTATADRTATFEFSTDVDQTGSSDNVNLDFDVAKDINVTLDLQDADNGAAGGDAIESLTVTGNFNATGSLILNGSQAQTIETINASAVSGGMKLDLSQSSANNKVTLGAGDDVLTMQGGQVTAQDTLDGGAGTDTIVVEDGDLTAVNFLNISNFETLGVSNVFNGADVDVSGLGFSTIQLLAGQTANILTVATGTTIEYTSAGATNEISINGSASSGTVTLKAKDATNGADDAIATGANVGTLILDANDAVINLDDVVGINEATNTIQIVGDNNVTLGDAAQADGFIANNGATIDASSFTGALNVVLSIAGTQSLTLSTSSVTDTVVLDGAATATQANTQVITNFSVSAGAAANNEDALQISLADLNAINAAGDATAIVAVTDVEGNSIDAGFDGFAIVDQDGENLTGVTGDIILIQGKTYANAAAVLTDIQSGDRNFTTDALTDDDAYVVAYELASGGLEIAVVQQNGGVGTSSTVNGIEAIVQLAGVTATDAANLDVSFIV